MVQVLSCIDASYCIAHADVDALVADVWLLEAFERVEQHQDVEKVDATPKNAPAEPVVTPTERAQLSASCF